MWATLLTPHNGISHMFSRPTSPLYTDNSEREKNSKKEGKSKELKKRFARTIYSYTCKCVSRILRVHLHVNGAESLFRCLFRRCDGEEQKRKKEGGKKIEEPQKWEVSWSSNSRRMIRSEWTSPFFPRMAFKILHFIIHFFYYFSVETLRFIYDSILN